MIRLGTINDLDIISTLYKETIGTSSMVKLYMRKHILAKQIYIKEIDGRIVGAYVYQINKLSNPYTCSKTPYNMLWLEQIMVFQDCQKKGIGKELLNHFFNKAKGNDVKKYMLVCRMRLTLYYKQFGFNVIETGTQKKRTEVYYVMEKTIQ